MHLGYKSENVTIAIILLIIVLVGVLNLLD